MSKELDNFKRECQVEAELIEQALTNIKDGLLTLQFANWGDAASGPEFAGIWRKVESLAKGARQRA